MPKPRGDFCDLIIILRAFVELSFGVMSVGAMIM